MRTKIMIFSKSNQPEIDCCHAGVADKRHSFIWCFEARLFVLKSLGREVQDTIRIQCICVGHTGLYMLDEMTCSRKNRMIVGFRKRSGR